LTASQTDTNRVLKEHTATPATQRRGSLGTTKATKYTQVHTTTQGQPDLIENIELVEQKNIVDRVFMEEYEHNRKN
jgi:hypothetical protein